MKTSKFPSSDNYSGIYLFNETDETLPITLKNIREITTLVEDSEECGFHLLEIVFVDEDEIRELNSEHLGHNYVTDIITFRYDEGSTGQAIEGTLYCCAPRIREQSGEFNQETETEFKRIVIHGLLHLAGYCDKTEADRKEMREREKFYMDQLN